MAPHHRSRYNRGVMIETFIIPEKTVITAKGEGAAVELGSPTTNVFLLTLKITEIVEQESLDISVFGSADGQTWDTKPLLSFPQRFYKGETPVLLDLTDQPAVKFVRAQWDVNRWGRGPETPMFEVEIGLREVPGDLLEEARREAQTRA